MKLKHIALVCSSEEHSDRFYKTLLGLEKMKPKTVPADLSKQIFNIDLELIIINYRGPDIHFEIFINDHEKKRINKIEHVCIETDHLEKFLEECRTLNVEMTQVSKPGKTLTFIRDFDGNTFEIKEK